MGRNKALLPWGDCCLLEAWIRRFKEAGITDVVAVVGPELEALRAELAPEFEPRWVVNPEPEATGPRESLLLGLDALASDLPAWFSPIDVPVVGAEVLGQVAAAYVEQAALGEPFPLAALPAYRGVNGHPVLASPNFIQHLYEGQRGDRIDELFSWATRRLVRVDVPDVRVVGNMNKPPDYQAFAPPAGALWDWMDIHDAADGDIDDTGSETLRMEPEVS
jgi:CTP:molybdopterin cytidylyltransferase MocA